MSGISQQVLQLSNIDEKARSVKECMVMSTIAYTQELAMHSAILTMCQQKPPLSGCCY